MLGSPTFTTVTSSNSMNVVTHTTAKVQPRAGVPAG